MTVTLMAVSGAFILLTGPIGLLSLVMVSQASQQSHLVLFLAAPANLLWYINSSVNFFLYLLTGSRFRQELGNVFSAVGKRRDSHHHGGDF